jgi:hypothetical protein
VPSTSSPDDLHSVIKAFEPALKSLDVRIVAVKTCEQDKWQNLITSVFLGGRGVEEVRKGQEMLPQPRTADLAFFVDAFPYSFSALQDLAQEEITLTSYSHQTIQKGRVNLSAMKVGSIQRTLRGSNQYVLSSSNVASTPETERGKLWSVFNQSREAKRSGYSSIYEMAKELLEIDLNPSDRKDFEVSIVVGDIVKIESVSFKGSRFSLIIKKARGLKGLQLNLLLTRGTAVSWNTCVWRRNVKLEDNYKNSGNRFCVVRRSYDLDDLLPFDTMGIELIHKASALTLSTAWAEVPLRNVVEPFLKTLGAFCPLDEFRKMLLDPVHYGKEPQKTFENAVVWLLSMAGFHTVHVGGKIKADGHEKSFDVLRAVESRAEIGCADIIAYEENEALLLVDCDVGPIDNKKIQSLNATAKFFEKSLNIEKLRIVPLLFSPKDYSELPQQTGMTIVGRDAMESVFREITKGNLKRARNIISTGTFGIMG